MKDGLPKTKAFLRHYCYKDVLFDQDNLLTQCNFCKQKAWRMEDIRHKDGCELGNVLEELGMITSSAPPEDGE